MTTLRLEPFPASTYDAWLAYEMERRFRLQFLPLYDDESAARAKVGAVASMAPHTGATELWQVADGKRQAGWLWLQPPEEPGGDLLLLDADSNAPADALLALLVARAGKAAHLLVDRMEGAATPTALAMAGAMVPTTTNMALRLDTPPPPSAIVLTPMQGDRFETWKAQNVIDYAQELETSTTVDHESALQEAMDSFVNLLPEGLATPDHTLFDVCDPQGVPVGMLWIARRSPTAHFVYDVAIDEAMRGRGLGRAAMNAAAAWSREQGGKVLALNVFGQNRVARNLYRDLGYQVILEEMVLDLMPSPATG